MDRLDSDKLHFFWIYREDRRASIEEDLMLLVCAREAKRGLLEGGGYPLEKIRFFCFFNTIKI